MMLKKTENHTKNIFISPATDITSALFSKSASPPDRKKNMENCHFLQIWEQIDSLQHASK